MGGALWSLLGSVVASVLAILSLMLIARVVGKLTYGQFVILQSTIALAGSVLGLTIGTTATKYTAELKGSDPERLRRILALLQGAILVLGGSATVAIIACAKPLAAGGLNSAALAWPLSIGALAICFIALDGYQKSVLVGLEELKSFAMVSVGGLMLSIPISVWLAQQYDLPGAMIGTVLASVLQCVLSRIAMVRKLLAIGIKLRMGECLSEAALLRQSALPALLSGFVVPPALWASQALLAHHVGYREVAILGVAMQWFNATIFIPTTAGRALLPILTDLHARNDWRSTNKIIQVNMLANIAISLVIAGVIAAASGLITQGYGPEFDGARSCLILASLVAVLVVAAAPVGQVINARGRFWQGLVLNLVWGAVYLLLAAALVARFGALGVLAAMGVAYLLHLIITLTYAFLAGRVHTAPSDAASPAN